MKSLVWFRNDLRIDDNPALKQACCSSDEVYGLYIYSPDQLKLHNEANCKIQFMIENLKSLEESLNKLNIPLIIIASNGYKDEPNEILNLVNKWSITNVSWNNQFGIDEETRDGKVKEILEQNNINYALFDDQVVYSPGTFKTGEGNPYSVFTPFKRRWVDNFNIDLLDIEFKYLPKSKTSLSSNINDFDFSFSKSHSVDMSLWKIGEKEAQSILINYLDNKVLNYARDRNDPIIDGTSRLSPYLALGIISPRRCILEALKRNNFELDSGEKGLTKWIDEIVWREFYKNIMFSFSRVSKGQPFQKYTNKIKWRFNKDEFNAWKNGTTGFPLSLIHI